MKRAHFIVHAAVLMSAFAAGVVASLAADSKKEAVESHSIVEMSPYVVTEKPFGMIPVNGWSWFNRFTKTILKQGILYPYKNGPSLESFGIKPGEILVALDGKAMVGRNFNELREFWSYGEVGATVRLTLRGTGKDESVYREVTIKRIPLTDVFPAPQPKPAGEKP